jgi:predicted MPP superfamily phosphohydrolase
MNRGKNVEREKERLSERVRKIFFFLYIHFLNTNTLRAFLDFLRHFFIILLFYIVEYVDFFDFKKNFHQEKEQQQRNFYYFNKIFYCIISYELGAAAFYNV